MERISAMSAAPATPLTASADAGAEHGRPLDLLLSPPRARTGWTVVPARVGAMCIVELQKLRHDRTELYTRAIQPALWLLIYGETFTRLHAIPTGGIPYLDFLAPGIIAQSAMFIAIFYGIMIIWERDAGVLTKLLVTPTPRAALITGKAFAAGVKATIQAVVVVIIAALLGVSLTWNPLKLIAVCLVVILGGAFFSCLSMTIAGIVLTRDRLMGIGQAITMPLFFSSSALYPVRPSASATRSATRSTRCADCCSAHRPTCSRTSPCWWSRRCSASSPPPRCWDAWPSRGGLRRLGSTPLGSTPLGSAHREASRGTTWSPNRRRLSQPASTGMPPTSGCSSRLLIGPPVRASSRHSSGVRQE
jgi:ABC-2 type transport system permease protein